jgi:hypothetical protein
MFLSLLFISLLMACGGGSDSNSGGGAAVQDGEGSNESIIGLTGRSIAIDTMELLGVMLKYEGYIDPNFQAPVSGPCGKSGTKQVTDGRSGTEGTVTVDYENCEDSVGGLRFSIHGQRTATFEPGKVTFGGSSLTINNDGGGGWTITPKNLSIDTAANPHTLTADMSIQIPRFGKIEAVSDPFAGLNLLCPDSGKLTLTAADSSFVTINGAPGLNLELNGSTDNQTLACSEIGVNVAGGDELRPPGAP